MYLYYFSTLTGLISDFTYFILTFCFVCNTRLIHTKTDVVPLRSSRLASTRHIPEMLHTRVVQKQKIEKLIIF